MHWTKTRDNGVFLAQDPVECARSLKLAFPNPDSPVTAQAFMGQVTKEKPVPKEMLAPAEPDQFVEPPDV